MIFKCLSVATQKRSICIGHDLYCIIHVHLFHFDIELYLFIWLKMHFEYSALVLMCNVQSIELNVQSVENTPPLKLCLSTNCIELNRPSRGDDDAPTAHNNNKKLWRQLLSVSNLFAFMHEIKLTRISKHNMNRNYKQYTEANPDEWMWLLAQYAGSERARAPFSSRQMCLLFLAFNCTFFFNSL